MPEQSREQPWLLDWSISRGSFQPCGILESWSSRADPHCSLPGCWARACSLRILLLSFTCWEGEKGSAGCWSLARNDHCPWFPHSSALSAQLAEPLSIPITGTGSLRKLQELQNAHIQQSSPLHPFPCLLLSQHGPAHLCRTKSPLKCQTCTSRGAAKTAHASEKLPDSSDLVANQDTDC